MVPEPSVSLSTEAEIDTQFKRFRLLPFRSPLLREYFRQRRSCFLFLRLLRCFNSPGYRLTSLCIQLADALSSTGRVYPFGDPRVKGCLPPHRSLSQAATSFIVFLCQGIHHIPLLRFSHAFDFKQKRYDSLLLQNNFFWLMLLLTICK